MVDHIVAKADGVPLYVEELTKAILGSGILKARGDAYVSTAGWRNCRIPETLQDSLMARLDQDGAAARSGAIAARCSDASLPMT